MGILDITAKDASAYAGGDITSITGRPFRDKIKNSNANQFIHAIQLGSGRITQIENLKWSCDLRHSKGGDKINAKGDDWKY